MKINEILTEAPVGSMSYGDIHITVDEHSIDRTYERGVDPYAVDYILKRLNKITDKLAQIDVGKQFWVYDWSRELSIGLRRTSSTSLSFMLKTVVPKKASLTPKVDKLISI